MPATNSVVPYISVVVPTRDRPDDARRCLESLSSVDYPHWDVVLVDQSDNDATLTVVREYERHLPNLTHTYLRERGASRARNKGIELSQGGILAFVDDDCTVKADWLNQVASAFKRHPEVDLIFGTVSAAPHDEKEYFIPTFDARREAIKKGWRAFLHTEGISAGMYLRRNVVSRVGTFDTNLGPGAPLFPCAEDIDYLYRVLYAGCGVLKTPRIVVEHHGARDYKSGAVARLLRTYGYASGAADMKFLRAGRPIALVLIASHALYCITRIDLFNLVSRRGPAKTEWITSYMRGLRASFQLGVNRRQCLYVSPANKAYSLSE